MTSHRAEREQMDQFGFNAQGFVKFDLETGLICSRGEEQLTLVPLPVLATLEPSKGLKGAAHRWGMLHGERLQARLLETDTDVGVEVLADHLGGTAAVLGMGRLSVEIRGDALMFRTQLNSEQAPQEGLNALLGGFLAGYVSALIGQSLDVLPLLKLGSVQLFWTGNPEAVAKVRGWIDQGTSPLDAIDRLSEGSK